MIDISRLVSANLPTDDFFHLHEIDRVSCSAGAVEKARRYTADTDFLLVVINQLLNRVKQCEVIESDAKELKRLREMERKVRDAVGYYGGPTA